VADAAVVAVGAAAVAAGAAAVAFPVVVAAAAAAFRVAVAAVSRGPVEEISPEEAPLARAASIVGLARGTFPAAAEAVVWLIPGTPHRATEVPLASD
jgi:hypothetical protein